MTTSVKSLLGVASSVLLAGCSVFGYRGDTETPDYQVIDRLGDIEIRHYGPRLAADTIVAAPDVEKAREQGFKRLAGYIFGDNADEQKIAMTAPVAQSMNSARGAGPVSAQANDSSETSWRIRFFLPRALSQTSAPAPQDARVHLNTVPAETYAVERFSGARDTAAVDKQLAVLNERLAESPWAPIGEPVAWFYDPPWTMSFLRRNEVARPVAKRDTPS